MSPKELKELIRKADSEFGNRMETEWPKISVILTAVEKWMHHTEAKEWPEDQLWEAIEGIK